MFDEAYPFLLSKDTIDKIDTLAKIQYVDLLQPFIEKRMFIAMMWMIEISGFSWHAST